MENRKRKEERNRQEWQKSLQENPDILRNNGIGPGKISRNQWYLHECATKKHRRSSQWANGDWECLIEELGMKLLVPIAMEQSDIGTHIHRDCDQKELKPTQHPTSLSSG